MIDPANTNVTLRITLVTFGEKAWLFTPPPPMSPTQSKLGGWRGLTNTYTIMCLSLVFATPSIRVAPPPLPAFGAALGAVALVGVGCGRLGAAVSVISVSGDCCCPAN